MLDQFTPTATSKSYWSVDEDVLVGQLGSARGGLTAAEAARRLREHGPNRVREHRRLTRLQVLANQIRNPLLWVLVFAAGASAMTGEWVDAVIVFVIVLATVSIGYAREYNAAAAAAALQARVRSRACVLRDGQPTQVPTEEVVPGDVVLLSAGSLIPADGVILEATDFFVSEAVLTGESFPVEKRSGSVATAAGLRDRLNCVFLGTNVRSGTARCVIAATGLGTQFGAIAHRLTLRPPETEFDRGIRRFGYLLTSLMLVMVGMQAERVLTGSDLQRLSDEALWRVAHVVGFLGDGVNDAPAMHAADTRPGRSCSGRVGSLNRCSPSW